MLTISKNQMYALTEDFRRRRREDRIDSLIERIRQQAPDALKSYTGEQARQYAGEAYDAAAKVGVTNLEYILNWAYIRLLTGTDFYNSPSFTDVLEHPFLHPDAKGRHIVLSFFAIQKLREVTL